jgi:LuxR family transcriptional regulator, regulator of acetate metabolism
MRMVAVAVQDVIERLLPERLHRLRRVTGLPVVFGGPTRQDTAQHELVITRLIGTLGDGLRNLAVPAGRGLGGVVLRDGVLRHIDDYAANATITHDYDRIVVEQERMRSLLAVPVIVDGVVRGVLYGAVRDTLPIGGRCMRSATLVAAQLQRDVEVLLQPPPESELLPPTMAALADLADLIRTTSDAALRERLIRIHRDLDPGAASQPIRGTVLAPRELEILRLVAVGASNLEVAAQLGLSPQTVKAYLRSAMGKLNVHNRTAAVHATRQAGVL